MADDLGAQEHLLERLYCSRVCSKVSRGENLQGLLGVEDVIFPKFLGEYLQGLLVFNVGFLLTFLGRIFKEMGVDDSCLPWFD